MTTERFGGQRILRISVMRVATAAAMVAAWCALDRVYAENLVWQDRIRASRNAAPVVFLLGVFVLHWILHRGLVPPLDRRALLAFGLE